MYDDNTFQILTVTREWVIKSKEGLLFRRIEYFHENGLTNFIWLPLCALDYDSLPEDINTYMDKLEIQFQNTLI